MDVPSTLQWSSSLTTYKRLDEDDTALNPLFVLIRLLLGYYTPSRHTYQPGLLQMIIILSPIMSSSSESLSSSVVPEPFMSLI